MASRAGMAKNKPARGTWAAGVNTGSAAWISRHRASARSLARGIANGSTGRSATRPGPWAGRGPAGAPIGDPSSQGAGTGPVAADPGSRTGVHSSGPGASSGFVLGHAGPGGHRPTELREGRLHPVAGRVLRPRDDARGGRVTGPGWGTSRRGGHPGRPDRSGARAGSGPVSYTHLRAHETRHDLV